MEIVEIVMVLLLVQVYVLSVRLVVAQVRGGAVTTVVAYCSFLVLNVLLLMPLFFWIGRVASIYSN